MYPYIKYMKEPVALNQDQRLNKAHCSRVNCIWNIVWSSQSLTSASLNWKSNEIGFLGKIEGNPSWIRLYVHLEWRFLALRIFFSLYMSLMVFRPIKREVFFNFWQSSLHISWSKKLFMEIIRRRNNFFADKTLCSLQVFKS